MGARATAEPVLRSSNENTTEIGLSDLQAVDDDSALDGEDDESLDNAAAANVPVRQGSPPKSKRKGQEIQKEGKKLKLPTDKKKTSSLVEGMLKSLEAQATASSLASDQLVACRNAELQFKKDQEKSQMQLREEDLKLKQQAQAHDQMMAKARLMFEMGASKDDVFAFMSRTD